MKHDNADLKLNLVRVVFDTIAIAPTADNLASTDKDASAVQMIRH